MNFLSLLKRVLVAFFHLSLGGLLGLILLEATLQVNPGLLWSGLGLPSPAETPLTIQEYDVRYSDADLFYWGAIRPIPPAADKIETHVRFESDEFGFANAAPMPATVDVVVLGRSYSLGAQAADPWPHRLAEQTGLKVLNLSQPGSGIDLKTDYWQRFGLRRAPRWIILETLPSMDLLGYHPPSAFIIEGLPFSTVQQFAHRVLGEKYIYQASDQIYPLTVDLPNRRTHLTFFSYYLAALTVEHDVLSASRDWETYQQSVLNLVQMAQAHSMCVLLLYVPTKENIYFPLATDPTQLKPALIGLGAWQLAEDQQLVQAPDLNLDPRRLQAQATAGRDLLADFAREQHLTFIDPTASLSQAALAGDDPFMVYDSHWSATGHRLVAQAVAEALRQTPCP